ncbi:MAG TPA: hypothetical protein VFB81_14605 [Myxococcales bacterium]|nr:hypothetical protein [Myxococcales bacterium]
MAPRLISRTVRQQALPEEARARMLALMQLCYEGVDPDRFRRDLAQKDHVILLLDRVTGELVGFSTILVRQERVGDDVADVLFSGDTVLHPDYWGQKVLDGAFARYLFARKLRHPTRSLRWLLLSGGYKTYLIIINYFPLTSPRRDREPTAREVAFRGEVCRRWFGEQFDALRGVLRFGAHYRVRSGIAPIDREAARHPDIAFFAARNPGHVDGEELVCVGEVRLTDLLCAAVRIGGKRVRRLLSSGAREPVAGAEKA